MSVSTRLACFLLVSFSVSVAVLAQQDGPPAQRGPGRIFLDVVVTPKSGPPVSGLQQQDFTLLDNKVPQTITSFQAFDARQAPIEVILVVDAVNTGYQSIAYERNQIDKFLRADGGSLAHPTALAILTDTGTQLQDASSSDGNALSASLDQYVVGLRTINRTAGFWGADEQFQISVEGLNQLATRLAARPGRKVVLWVSPGWPLLSGPNVELDPKEQEQLFSEIVGLSTLLQRARITLYSIDPLGTGDVGFRTFYWKEFVKGISKPSQVQIGNLALEVLATQSGGLALNASNDTATLLHESLADTAPYYEISFVPASAEKKDEYHQLEIRLARPGLTARTRQGYYAQPTPRD
jgi:VWFA-related protein